MAQSWIVTAVFLGSLAALVAGCLNLAGSGDQDTTPYWQADNESEIMVLVSVNGLVEGVVDPRAVGQFFGRKLGFKTAVIKAYAFLPGEGDVRTTRAPEGTRFIGGRGELIYCETFSESALEAADFTVTVERNVVPGTYDELADPCPETQE